MESDETLFDILAVMEESEWTGVEEIADAVGVAKSTVHRHLQSLLANEFVVQRDGRYRLGYRFLELGGVVQSSDELIRKVRPVVGDLAEETGETIQFVVEEHGLGVIVYLYTGENSTRANVPIGTRYPLHLSAAGKAILAKLPVERVREIIDRRGLEAQTDQSITRESELMAELEEISQRGFAFNYGENNEVARGVGVAITCPSEEILGGLSIMGPPHRMKGERFEEDIPELICGTVQEFEVVATHT